MKGSQDGFPIEAALEVLTTPRGGGGPVRERIVVGCGSRTRREVEPGICGGEGLKEPGFQAVGVYNGGFEKRGLRMMGGGKC